MNLVPLGFSHLLVDEGGGQRSFRELLLGITWSSLGSGGILAGDEAEIALKQLLYSSGASLPELDRGSPPWRWEEKLRPEVESTNS